MSNIIQGFKFSIQVYLNNLSKFSFFWYYVVYLILCNFPEFITIYLNLLPFIGIYYDLFEFITIYRNLLPFIFIFLNFIGIFIIDIYF